MNPVSKDAQIPPDNDNRSIPTTSEVVKEEQWQMMFELQQQSMMQLIEIMKAPSASLMALPEFDPDLKEADARAWCSAIDVCMTEKPLEGGALIITLSKSLKGSAAPWLSQVAHAGMTWQFFKDLFLARFDCAETVAATLINVNNSRPKDGECLAAYASRLMNTVVAKWKDMKPEEIAISYVLAHTSQFDNRLHRLAYTKEISTRSKLLQELKSFSTLKRKGERDPPLDTKRFKFTKPDVCSYCKKVGHKIIDCRKRKFNMNSNLMTSTCNTNAAATTAPNIKKSVICFTCGEKGHIATHCMKSSPRRSPSGIGMSRATGSSASGSSDPQQRRVNYCEVQGVSGMLEHSDCLHLQLYRDPKDRYKKGQTKASLSLQQFLGFESGFTLDKESNTIAIICQDVVVVLAFETRERLIAWQVKVGSQLGSSREFLVLIGGGGARKLPAGPARLHLQGRRFAVTSGVPPRLLGLWELAHLRRYGVVEGRFCFEGGSHSGKGEGLHVLITDQAQEITDEFDLAARGNITGQRSTPSRKSAGDRGNKTRPSTRLSDLNTIDQSLPDSSSGLYEENFFGEDCGRVSPYWLSDERRGSEDPDFRRSDIDVGAKPPWGGADHVTLERCSNCLTKLGVSRSSTVALSPTCHFNPAWTMEAVPESSSDSSSNNTEYLTPRMIRKTLEACQCKDKPPMRPPKPGHLESKKPPAPLPSKCSCVNDNNYPTNNPKVGPYENYDVPKPALPVVDNSEYYDTPKRIKKAITEDLFQVTKSTTPGSLVLKKNCGCILKFASKKKPVIVECEENIQPVECPCQKVTNWANNLISLPYCKRESASDRVNTEILTNQKSEEMAIYATVDMSRKTNRQSGVSEKDNQEACVESAFTNYQNIEPTNEHEGPFANYENLEFALSLEYYENAKDLLKKAGVTQKELDALSANVEIATSVLPKKSQLCKKCGHSQIKTTELRKNKSDEYLLMEPSKEVRKDVCRTVGPNTGYTPMSPNPNWSQSLKHPMQKLHKVEIEKSLSIPVLNGGNKLETFVDTSSNNNKEAIQKRSCSVDSARLLEDLKEFDSSIGSHATSSSLETLRNLAIDRRTSSPCDDDRECYDCCKSSGSENKTSEESSSKEVPHLRNKLMDNAQIKRSSSVPCKSGGNRDSSSSNDSGVSSCSMKHGGEFQEFEMPLTSGHSRYHYMMHKRMRGNLSGCLHASLPRKSKSSDLLREQSMQLYKGTASAKSSSAEAEVPVLPPKQFKGVLDTHSTSSGTSDMSDYIETLSLTSSHSSSDTPSTMRISRQPTNTLRPRSGKEYHNLDPIITSMYKTGKDLNNYTNLP